MEQVLETLRTREYDAEEKDGKVLVKLGFPCICVSVSYDYAFGGFVVSPKPVGGVIAGIMAVALGLWALSTNSVALGILQVCSGLYLLMSVVLTEVKSIEVRRLVTDINLMRKQEQH